MSRRYRATTGGATFDAEVRPDGAVVIDDVAFTVTALGEGRVAVAAATGSQVQVVVAAEGRLVWVGARGRAARLGVTAVVPGRAQAAAHAAADMTAPMPATVVTIAARAGAAVAKGDAVVIIEAMKMTVTVRAPRSGVVKAVRCEVGELVKAGAVLAELEP